MDKDRNLKIRGENPNVKITNYEYEEPEATWNEAEIEPIEDCKEEEVCEGTVVSEGGGEELKIDNFKVSQWSVVGENAIVAVSNTFETLEPGYYSLGSSPSIGMYFMKDNVQLNKLYRLPNTATDIILNDISKFWTLEDTYKKYNRVFRRNYLLYSAPGTGKTSLINLMCQELIEKYNGIVFSLTCESDIRMFPDAVRRIRAIEPDRKIITVIEDIDNFIAANEYERTSVDSHLLNILDGNLKAGGIVTIATTNYIDKIAGRYKNRPSRFDRVVEFPLPNDESRKIFIEKTVCPEDLKKIDINHWVDRTEGFTIDHINELILLYFVFGHDEEESFKTIEAMVDGNDRLRNVTSVNKKSEIGFGTLKRTAKHNSEEVEMD